MDKLWLIVKREYLTRVKKWTFILATLATPLAVAGFIAVSALLANQSEEQRIALKDDSGIFVEKTIKDSDRAKFIMSHEPLDSLIANYEEMNFDGVLHVPDFGERLDKDKELEVNYYSDGQLGVVTKMFIESRMAKRIKSHKIDESGYDKKIIENFETEITIDEKAASGEDTGVGNRAEIATAFGMMMGFFMYMAIFIYGMMVMRSVMEEKTNRIVEVMISSVKPFQLMMGKLIGVGGVGLTQLLIWIILIPGVVFITGLLFPIDPASMSGAGMPGGGQEMNPEEMESLIYQMGETLGALNWWFILPLFIIFFMGGYFVYSSLFAAIGSTISDDMGESQSLTMPISMLVVLAVLIMSAVVQNPNSSLATWSSMVPFFSPVVMPARLAFDPPLWEVILSVLILVVSSVFFVWLSARIYRVGILMYGKKVTFKELAKWMFYKG